MKARLAVLLGLLLTMFSVHGQDKILLKSGDTITAKNVVLEPPYVLYEFPNVSNGPVNKIRSILTDSIFYKSGKRVGTSREAVAQNSYFEADSKSSSRFQPYQKVSIDAGALVFRDLEIQLEKTFGQGYIGLRVPFIVGLERNNFTQNNINKVIGSGLDILFYLNPQDKWQYYFGLATEYTGYQVPAWKWSGEPILVVRPYYGIQFTQGVTIHVDSRSVFQCGISYGYRKFDESVLFGNRYVKGILSYGIKF